MSKLVQLKDKNGEKLYPKLYDSQLYKLNDYSKEQIVGVWTDGSLIYRKVIVVKDAQIESSPTPQIVTYKHNISNLKMVIGKQIVFYNNSNITYFTPVQEASDKFFSIYSVDNTNINIKTQNENWTGGDFYFILYYLKK